MNSIYIYRKPTGIGGALSTVLVGLTIRVQPALQQLTDDPALGTDSQFIFVDNVDIRQAIAEGTIGSDRAKGFYPLLPLGRATRIPRDCCNEIDVTPVIGDETETTPPKPDRSPS